jgi:hypothetical protein
MEEINQIQKEIKELKKTINLLRNSSTIPFDIDTAFTDRLVKKISTIDISNKDVNSENVNFTIDSVNYTTLNKPDVFLEVQLKSGYIKYIPFYD